MLRTGNIVLQNARKTVDRRIACCARLHESGFTAAEAARSHRINITNMSADEALARQLQVSRGSAALFPQCSVSHKTTVEGLFSIFLNLCCHHPPI